MEQLIKDRSKNEYICALGPKLLLIASKPLEHDKEEIFDSMKGIDYLSHCFRSKFKAAETHITYISDERNITSIVKNGFDKILKFYSDRNTLDVKKLVIGFIGENAYKEFKEEADNSYFAGNFTVDVREAAKNIRVYCMGVNGNRDFVAPFLILPDTSEDYSNVADILNQTNLANEVATPYSSTQEMINHFNMLLDNFDKKSIKGIRLTAKINYTQAKPKTEYLKVFDYCTKHEILYCPTDEICANDSKELKSTFATTLKKVLLTIPICGDDIEKYLSYFSYKNQIKLVTEEEITPSPYEFIPDRPHWKLTGTANGQESEWYLKWKATVFPALNLDKKEITNNGYADNHKYEWIYDIEVFKNDWLFLAKTLDGNSKVICWNDAKNLAKWIKNKILIGFNNAAYDDAVIRHAMSLPYAEEGTMSVKEFSDSLIFDEKSEKNLRLRPEFRRKKSELIPPFLSWDVSFHMPFDIRRNSLKKLTMSVLDKRNYDSEISFDTPRPLTEDERREVEKYCELDVDNTRELFLPKPGDLEKKAADPNFKCREFARESYDIRWNLIIVYKMTAKTLINKSSSFAGKVLCGEDSKPNPDNTFKLVDGKKQYYAIPELAMRELAGTPVLQFYLDHQGDPEYIREKFECYLGPEDDSHKYQFGFGGLHQALINYTGTNLCNFDVASLYPSLLIQYNLASRNMKNPQAYKEVYDTRIKAKHEGNTLLNLGLKLVLNGAIGAMLSAYNPLYDTWSNSTVCVHGQLLLFILAKRLFEAEFNIIQTNTDGIMVEKRDDVDFMAICKKWEEETRLVLEYDDIDLVAQLNVNNYYARFHPTKPGKPGKVKSKGVFLSNEKNSLAVSRILCNIVEEKPFLNECRPRDFVIYKKHSIGEIYDAVTNKKVEGRSMAFVIGKQSDPRTQAYYSRSRNEREVVKKDEKGKPILDEQGNPVTEIVHTVAKITSFTDHMLLVDDVNTLTLDEINTSMYVSIAKNLLNEQDIFGPYYGEGFVKSDEPAYLQALNALKDNTDEHPKNSNVYGQNFLFECDYLSREEQEELINPIEKYTYRIVWSGHRSYHIVIRLNKAVTTNVYKKIWYYLQNKLSLIGADEMTAFASKYTRTPDQVNPKTGEMQTLYSENKYIFDVDKILEDMPKLKDELKKPTQFKGKVTMKALERHIKRLSWDAGDRFASCQKLSPILISQVTFDELLKLIPCPLEKDHCYVIRAKYRYWEKHKDEY